MAPWKYPKVMSIPGPWGEPGLREVSQVWTSGGQQQGTGSLPQPVSFSFCEFVLDLFVVNSMCDL